MDHHRRAARPHPLGRIDRKAAAKSRSSAAFTIRTCRPMAGPASTVSLIWRSASGAAGSNKAAMVVDLGTSSCSSPSRLAVRSTEVKTTPVTFPPGRLRLATRPVSDRIAAGYEHNRDCRGCGHRSPRRERITDDDRDFAADKVDRQPWKPVGMIVPPSGSR